jgi:hypothetical protein
MNCTNSSHKTISIKKIAKAKKKKQLSKEETQMTNKYMKNAQNY